jgi:hypothetical protein
VNKVLNPFFLALITVSCSGEKTKADLSDSGDTPTPVETSPPDTALPDLPDSFPVPVSVTMDNEPVDGAVIVQGGSPDHWLSGPDGTVTIEIDTTLGGDLWLHASHPQARIAAKEILRNDGELVVLNLVRFDTVDNLSYEFQHPGTPTLNDTTNYCSHCHRSMVDDWYKSPHRTASSNPVLQDLYAGTALAHTSEEDCSLAGGQWWAGINPGTTDTIQKCYLGDGALPAYNEACGSTAPCDGVAENTGACADCHAPGIDGELGGRDLHEATGIAYEYGVHCDVCHKVESVSLEGEPGVAGKLKILRPSEEGSSIFLWQPLTFGPYHDVANPRMGSVHRDHFLSADLCQACHEYQSELAPTGSSVDLIRWPEGLPIQSTFSEWEDGPYSPGAPCQSCHMPPDPEAGNTVDVQYDEATWGLASGWWRPTGSVRKHAWYGPRQPEARMLKLAAALEIKTTQETDELQVEVTVTNAGAGHAIPTGEAMRSLVLAVEASCNGLALPATGGDAIPDFGGSLIQKSVSEDWNVWPGAKVGQVIRVIKTTGEWHNYEGVGAFSEMTAQEKGMPRDSVQGSSTITALSGNQVTLDQALPSGDIAILGEPGWPAEGTPSKALAGTSGFAFARVMVAPDGRRHVHHSAANDLASDNRLMPQTSWTSHHQFATNCATPTVRAVLVHRAYPLGLARSRGWELNDSIMVEVEQ